MKILVVDDDPILRDLATAILTARGDTVITVDSGEAAVEMVSSGVHHFDAVLMDQKMPGIGGVEAARRIRTLPDYRGQVSILAWSGGDAPKRQASDGFLSKDAASLARLRDAVSDSVALGQARVIADQQPPRSTLVNWMKLNLLGVFGLFASFIGFSAGGIWAASAWNSDLRHDSADLKRINAAQDVRLDDEHKAMVDVDRRLNEMAAQRAEGRRDAEIDRASARRETDTNLANARRETDANLAATKQDLAVLQAQYKILADRAQQQPPPPLLQPGRRP